jgi:predicted ABC-type ATPase
MARVDFVVHKGEHAKPGQAVRYRYVKSEFKNTKEGRSKASNFFINADTKSTNHTASF